MAQIANGKGLEEEDEAHQVRSSGGYGCCFRDGKSNLVRNNLNGEAMKKIFLAAVILISSVTHAATVEEKLWNSTITYDDSTAFGIGESGYQGVYYSFNQVVGQVVAKGVESTSREDIFDFTLTANQGYGIQQINFWEWGIHNEQNGGLTLASANLTLRDMSGNVIYTQDAIHPGSNADDWQWNLALNVYLSQPVGAFSGQWTRTLTASTNNDNGYAIISANNTFNGYPQVGGNTFLFMTIANVSPIPEPETCAMFIAGLGLIGSIVRRKKQQQSAA